MNLTIKGEATIPEGVWAVGLLRDPETYSAPIRDEETGAGVAPLTVIDGDGERAMPVFTSHEKAERGIPVPTCARRPPGGTWAPLSWPWTSSSRRCAARRRAHQRLTTSAWIWARADTTRC